METTGIKLLAALSEAESVALLATQDVGRLVYTRRALPAVSPVNFVLRDGAVWIWTASTSSMWQAVRGAVVAFEADRLDAVTRSGWSVVVLGVAQLIVDPAEIGRALRDGPEPWVSGRKEHLIRVPIEEVSGRRIIPEGPGGGTFERAGEGPALPGAAGER